MASRNSTTPTPTPIPSHVRDYLDTLSSKPAQLHDFRVYLDENYANGNAPTTTNTRLIHPYPTHEPQISLCAAIAANPDDYSIPTSDKDISRQVRISSLPLYLVYCGRRMTSELSRKYDVSTGWHNVFRCALSSGLSQLAHDPHVQKLITRKQETYSISPGAMMSGEIEKMRGKLTFEPPRSTMGADIKGIVLYDEMNSRINRMCDDIGMSKSLLMITAIAFGFYNQPEIVQDRYDPYDHSYVVAEHVQCFDALVRIWLAMADEISKLAKDFEARRELVQQARRSSGGKRSRKRTRSRSRSSPSVN